MIKEGINTIGFAFVLCTLFGLPHKFHTINPNQILFFDYLMKHFSLAFVPNYPHYSMNSTILVHLACLLRQLIFHFLNNLQI